MKIAQAFRRAAEWSFCKYGLHIARYGTGAPLNYHWSGCVSTFSVETQTNIGFTIPDCFSVGTNQAGFVVPPQEVLQGDVGPPFNLTALRAFTAAEFMEENIDFLLEVMESERRVQWV